MSLVDEVEKAIEAAKNARECAARLELAMNTPGNATAAYNASEAANIALQDEIDKLPWPAILAAVKLAEATKAWRLAKFQSDLAAKDVKGWDKNVDDEYIYLEQLADCALLEADEKWAAFKRAEDAYRQATKEPT